MTYNANSEKATFDSNGYVDTKVLVSGSDWLGNFSTNNLGGLGIKYTSHTWGNQANGGKVANAYAGDFSSVAGPDFRAGIEVADVTASLEYYFRADDTQLEWRADDGTDVISGSLTTANGWILTGKDTLDATVGWSIKDSAASSLLQVNNSGRVEARDRWNGKAAQIASATSTDLGKVGNTILLTGTTTIDYFSNDGYDDGTIVKFTISNSSNDITIRNQVGAPGAGYENILCPDGYNMYLHDGDSFDAFLTPVGWKVVNLESARKNQRYGDNTASASALTLNNTGYRYPITGSTTIDTLNVGNFNDGDRVVLQAVTGLTVTHQATTAGDDVQILTKSGLDLILPAAGWVELFYNNTSWIEEGSSVDMDKVETSATISGGIVPYTSGIMVIDTEASASTDDLDSISGGVEGRMLIIRAANSARTVVVKDVTGNISLVADVTLDHTRDNLHLIYMDSIWCELGASNNAA